MFDRVEIADTYFWWLAEHHDGRWSDTYRRLCQLGRFYTPSPLARGPASPDAYRTLCARAGCAHLGGSNP